MTGPALVVLTALEKRFETDAGTIRAVDGIDLTIEPGTSLAITGPSGCGKSTLLSMIGALEVPSAGRVSIDDVTVSALPEARRAQIRRERLGFIFQSHNLQPFMTAVENVSFQLALAGRTNGHEHADALLGRLGLGHVRDKFPDQLSGGERQRVAVARALVHRPGLLLADEPTGALDRSNSSIVMDLLVEAQHAVGATLIVITHDLAIAHRLERVIALRDGRVIGDVDRMTPDQPPRPIADPAPC